MIGIRDTSTSAACWRDARDKHRDELIAVEGEAKFVGLQQFLACVHALTSERRVLRYLYTAQKPD